MNRAWITGITLATVAGTGTAAYAGMHATTDEGLVQAAPEQIASSTSAAAAAQQLAFQAGPAGTVNLTNDGVAITVTSVLPASGWTLVSYGPAATHVEVVLTDGAQNVTFKADLVNGEVEASIDATSLTTLPPETTTPATPAPQPAVPPVVVVPVTQPPSSAHTSSPSGSGEHEDDDEGEHEDEHEEGGDD